MPSHSLLQASSRPPPCSPMPPPLGSPAPCPSLVHREAPHCAPPCRRSSSGSPSRWHQAPSRPQRSWGRSLPPALPCGHSQCPPPPCGHSPPLGCTTGSQAHRGLASLLGPCQYPAALAHPTLAHLCAPSACAPCAPMKPWFPVGGAQGAPYRRFALEGVPRVLTGPRDNKGAPGGT